MVEFSEGKLDGKVLSVRHVKTIKQSSIGRCPHYIMVPEHYREDESCRCDDPNHKDMAEWGYVWDGNLWKGEEEGRMTPEQVGQIDQTVIQGTLVTEDLVAAFTDEYERLGGSPASVELFRSHVRLEEGEDREEELYYDLEELFGLLGERAPAGTSFGSHPGDGADFGFWTHEEEMA